MTEGFDLGAFLQDARAEGQQDSEGNFTIAQDKALDKLAHFSLAGEFDWVLKVVQGVNAWGCPFLQVSQTRVATSFYFKPPAARFPSDSEIVGALRHGSMEKAGGVHELCIALRALVDQAKLSFVLTTRYEGELGEPIYSGDDVSSLSDRVRRKWSALTEDGVRLTVSHFRGNESFTGRYIPTFSKIARRNVAIAKILEERAYCSPARIYLDGREITNPFLHPKIGGSLYTRPLAFAYEGRSEDELPIVFQPYPALTDYQRLKRPTALQGSDRTWAMIQTMDYLSVEEYSVSSSNPLSAVNLRSLRDRNHQVHWLRYGVICEVESIRNTTLGTTARIYVHGNEFSTDLTGLSLQLESEQTETKLAPFTTNLGNSLIGLPSKFEFLTSRVAPQAIIPFQPDYKEDLKRLDAGFSIFTAGLTSGESAMGRLSRELHKCWRTLRGLPFQKKMVEGWAEFAIREAVKLVPELSRERRKSHL